MARLRESIRDKYTELAKSTALFKNRIKIFDKQIKSELIADLASIRDYYKE
jgi:hypothetical protein